MEIKYTKHFVNDMKRLFSSNPFYSIPRWFRDTRYEIKWGFQRMFRGYDDRVYWGLYYEITRIVIPVLKWMKEHKTGYGYLEHLPDDASIEKMEEEWNKIYDQMIVGFEVIYNDENFIPTPEDEKRIQNALSLFAKHFRNLWD